MKKVFFALSAVLAAGSLIADSASVSKFAVSIGSKGPDAYADGTLVAPGTAAYRVVFVKDGSSFGGFYPNGSLVDAENNILIKLPLAANAKSGLDDVTFFYSADDFVAGTFILAFLDTRGPAGAEVLGYAVSSLKSKSTTDNSPMGKAVSLLSGVVGDTDTAMPTDVEAPVITSFDAKDGKVEFKNVAKGVPYAVQTSSDLENWDTAPVSSWVSGSASVASAAVAGDEGTTKFVRIKVKPSVKEVK